MSNDPVVELAALADLGAFRFLDVRDPATFATAHAEGAVTVPIEAWESAAKIEETSLDNIAHWESAIGALGIDNETLAVVYDDGRMTEAARVWFILQHFGAKAVILNGGWPTIASGNLPSLDVAPLVSGQFRARLGFGSVGVIDRNNVRAELGSSTQILDARSAAEFDGADLRKNTRGGHLPGAHLLSHTSLLDGRRLRDADELRGLFTDAGFKPGDDVVTHCDGGGRAALAAVAAVRAGYTDVRAYYLSFADWARDESCPIVRD